MGYRPRSSINKAASALLQRCYTFYQAIYALEVSLQMLKLYLLFQLQLSPSYCHYFTVLCCSLRFLFPTLHQKLIILQSGTWLHSVKPVFKSTWCKIFQKVVNHPTESKKGRRNCITNLCSQNTTQSLSFLSSWTSMWWYLDYHICLGNIYRVITNL